MQKEIRYGGLATNPSDYDAADGQLSAAIGLVNKDGGMRPMWQPATVGASLGDRRVLFLHATTSYRHYIVQEPDGVTLEWIAEEYLKGDYTEQEVLAHLVTIKDDIGTVVTVNAVGNTLIVVTNTGLHYIRWKTNAYDYIGQQPPEMDIQFGVTGTHAENYMGMFASGARGYAAYSKKRGVSATNNIWELVADTHKRITEDNHFYAPFLVRYCYRLFDGSMIMHSAPVFIPVSAPYNIQIEPANIFVRDDDPTRPSMWPVDRAYWFAREIDEYGNGIDIDEDMYAFRYQPNNVGLTYNAKCSEITSLKEDWQDIVKSVDIFVTTPILRELIGKPISEVGDVIPYGAPNSIKPQLNHYANDKLDTRQIKTIGNTERYHISFVNAVEVDLPRKTDAEYLKEIKNASTFFKIASFDLEKDEMVIGTWTDVPIGTGVLSSLATQEAMVDDYRTHNILIPHYNDEGVSYASLFAYNNRLNVSGVDDELFKGFAPAYMTPYDDRMSTSWGGENMCMIREIRVYIQTEDGEKIVSQTWNSDRWIWQTALMNQPLFYPDRRAKKMLIKLRTVTDNTYRWYEFPMTESPMLNGSFTMGGIYNSLATADNPLPEPVAEPTAPTEGSDIENTVSKVYTSEVDNPFYFPATTINTVGTGEIMATTTTTKALSQGQFGQFPLYAFCTDGIWALTVGSDGKYTSMHPVTRDVCTNIGSITQIDDAVLFVSDRGIMMLQGSSTVCLTDGIIGEEAFDPSTLPHLAHFRDMDGSKLAMTHEYLADCRMVYDYEHQHIIVYNPNKPYAFVLSMKTKLWGMMESSIASTINSYPEALAIDKNGRLVTFGDTAQERVQGLLVTRPLKFDLQDIYKTIHTLKQTGMFKKGHVQTLLYGTRDGYKYYLIGSSVDEWIRGLRGTPWRWFRIALLTDLEKGESISGARVEFEAKETQKMH